MKFYFEFSITKLHCANFTSSILTIIVYLQSIINCRVKKRIMKISPITSIAGYILLFFALIFLISGILLNVYFNKKVIENIQGQITDATQGKYALTIEGLTINLFTNTITVQNLVIAPVKIESTLKAQYIFKAKALKIIDFSILYFIKDRALLIDRIEFEEPQISIFQGYEKIPMKKKNIPENNFSIYNTISKNLNSLSINSIDIMNSKFNIYKNGIDTLPVFSTNDNSISVKKFSVNSETDQQNRLFFAEKFEIVLNKFSYHLANGLYSMHGKSLYASYLDSILIVDSLRLVPNFTKKKFADEAEQQISRVEFISSKVKCKTMDVKSFFENNWLVIHKIEIAGCSIDVYRDNKLPLKRIIRPSLQSIVKNLPFFVSVDSIEMNDGELSFEVLNPDANSTGKLTVNKMNTIITGVQNDTSSFSDDQSIKAVISGYIFNKGRFRQNFTFPLKATKEFFYSSGKITAMPMALFNPIIEPAKHILIKSGQLDSVNFSFVANENSSEGTMKFMYHDLKVEVMNKKIANNGFKEKLQTIAVNNLIVKNNNPGKNGVIRISKIYAQHNPYRFFVFYSMQSVLSGISPAIEGERKAKWMQKKK